MAKQHFFVRLLPPRPTFPFDMSADERALMLEHVAFMQRYFQAGALLVCGPVLSAEPYGMAVFEVDDEAAARRILDEDPTVRSGLNRYDIAPMRVGAARGV